MRRLSASYTVGTSMVALLAAQSWMFLIKDLLLVTKKVVAASATCPPLTSTLVGYLSPPTPSNVPS